MRGLTVLAAACALACAAPAAPPRRPAEIVPGEVVVAFAPDAAAAQRARAMAVVDADGSRALGSTGIRVVELGDGESVGAAVRELERLPGVRYAEPNYVVRAALTPNDPLFGDGTLFGLLRIGAPAAWDVTTGSGVPWASSTPASQASHPTSPRTAPGPRLRRSRRRRSLGLRLARHARRGHHRSRRRQWPRRRGRRVRRARAAAAGPRRPRQRNDRRPGRGLRLCRAGGDPHRQRQPDVHRAVSCRADAIALSPKTLFVVAAGNGPGGSDNDLTPAYPCSLVSANMSASRPATASTGSRRSRTTGSSVDLAAPGAGIVSTVPALRPTRCTRTSRAVRCRRAGRSRAAAGRHHGFTGGALFDSPAPAPTTSATPTRESSRLRSRARRQRVRPSRTACACSTAGADALVVEVGPSAAGPVAALAELTGTIRHRAPGPSPSSFPDRLDRGWHVAPALRRRRRLRLAGDGAEVTRSRSAA